MVVFGIQAGRFSFEAEAESQLAVGDPFGEGDDLGVAARAEVLHGLPGLHHAGGRGVTGDEIAVGGHELVDEGSQMLR